MNQQTGKFIIVIGLAVVIAGVAVYFLGNKLNWLGRLPGDIRVERDNFQFYFPITTMILISVVITIIVQLFKRFF